MTYRRMGGAGIRRGLRAPSGPSAGPAAPSFDRADLGMLAGFDPDPLPYLAMDGAYRIFLQTARWSYDLAGNPVSPYLLQQGTSPAQPLSEPTGLLGKPSVYYTTDDFLSTTDGVLAGILDGTQPHTIYAAIDRDVDAQVNTICSLGVSASSSQWVTWRMTTGGGVGVPGPAKSDSVGSTANTGTLPDGANPARVTFAFDGSAFSTWVGSAPDLVAAANARNPVCDRFMVGCARNFASSIQFMTGRIGLLLIYRLFHSVAQRAYVWDLLQSHYPGLP